MSVAGTVCVRVPATSANLGPGFDSLGLALGIYDEVTVSISSEPGVCVEVTGEGAARIPRDHENFVVRGVTAVFAAAGLVVPGIRVCAQNRVPFGRGLGSSASAVAAGVIAGASLLEQDRIIQPEELLENAAAIEGHPDNVAAALFGGLTIAWLDDTRARFTRLAVHPEIAPLVLVPAATASTAQVRELIPAQVPHADAVFNVSRSALLIAALTENPALLLDATADRLHQSYRAAAMPETANLVQILRQAGFAAVVSGAGPSVLVLAHDTAQRQAALDTVSHALDENWHPLMLSVSAQGATVVS
jgi:homoserine kinase